MAKIYGLFGSMTGKLADTVMSVRNGEQIARKYQPVVYNPSTPAQVAQRAKLKLLSQLSAVMAPVIAMPRQGAISSRNRFTKVNFPSLSYSDNTATIDLTAVKLTHSVVSLPDVVATAGTGGIAVSLEATAALDVTRVVYVAFRKMGDETLRLANSVVASTPGADNAFNAIVPVEAIDVPYVIYAYGVRDNTESARVLFGDMQVPTAQSVANLLVSRTLTENDVTVTETKALEYPASTANHAMSGDPDDGNRTSKKK